MKTNRSSLLSLVVVLVTAAIAGCTGESRTRPDRTSTLTILLGYGDHRITMWPIFRDDHPVTPLIPLPRYTIAHVRVKGLRSPLRVWPTYWAAQLRLEEVRDP